jgi:hypothetical protein
MTTAKSKTVSTKWLETLAARIERHADESLPTWIILGQMSRYGEDMGKAAILRRAAKIESIAARRVFLMNNGIEA